MTSRHARLKKLPSRLASTAWFTSSPEFTVTFASRAVSAEALVARTHDHRARSGATSSRCSFAFARVGAQAADVDAADAHAVGDVVVTTGVEGVDDPRPDEQDGDGHGADDGEAATFHP